MFGIDPDGSDGLYGRTKALEERVAAIEKKLTVAYVARTLAALALTALLAVFGFVLSPWGRAGR